MLPVRSTQNARSSLLRSDTWRTHVHSTVAMAGILLAMLSVAPDTTIGFLDADARHLLTGGSVESPERFTRAVCGGKSVAIRHVKTQPRGEKDTGRATARNFTEAPLRRFIEDICLGNTG